MLDAVAVREETKLVGFEKKRKFCSDTPRSNGEQRHVCEREREIDDDLKGKDDKNYYRGVTTKVHEINELGGENNKIC